MTPKKPVRPPTTAANGGRVLGHGKVTSSPPWQDDPNRREQNRKIASDQVDNAKKMQEAYSDHPKDKAGNNICWATKGDGKHCTLPAGQWTDHEGWGKCSFHGGNTPTLRTSAARYMGGEIIDKMTVAYGYGGPIELSPIDALLQEVRRTGGHVAWLGERINMMHMDTEKPINPVHAEWVELYHKERAHLVKVAKTALDAGISERKVRIAEQQGAMLIAAFNKVFDGLGLSVEQRRLIPGLVPNVLRELTDPEPQFQRAERVEVHFEVGKTPPSEG